MPVHAVRFSSTRRENGYSVGSDLTIPVSYTHLDVYKRQLFQRYRYRVPVIRVGNTDVLELKFTLEELLKALS